MAVAHAAPAKLKPSHRINKRLSTIFCMVPISIPFSASVDFPLARTRLLKAVETMTKGVLHATYPYFKKHPTAVSMIFFNRLRFIILFHFLQRSSLDIRNINGYSPFESVFDL